jgi:hypothetical protein
MFTGSRRYSRLPKPNVCDAASRMPNEEQPRRPRVYANVERRSLPVMKRPVQTVPLPAASNTYVHKPCAMTQL